MEALEKLPNFRSLTLSNETQAALANLRATDTIPTHLLPHIPQRTPWWLAGRKQFLFTASVAYTLLGLGDVNALTAKQLLASAHPFLQST
jgi:hypothetical protein